MSILAHVVREKQPYSVQNRQLGGEMMDLAIQNFKFQVMSNINIRIGPGLRTKALSIQSWVSELKE